MYLEDHEKCWKQLKFGFQSNKSTVPALLHAIDFISKAFSNNELVVAVFLDLRKAFDLVDHNILFLKLEKYGIRGAALNWFKSYLKDQVQYVLVNGSLSELFTLLNIAVPQGSILGSILFLIYINDLFNCNNLFNILFADDTTALTKGKNIEDLSNFINSELQKLGTWLRSNKLAVKTDKSKIIIFYPKGKLVPDNVVWFV